MYVTDSLVNETPNGLLLEEMVMFAGTPLEDVDRLLPLPGNMLDVLLSIQLKMAWLFDGFES